MSKHRETGGHHSILRKRWDGSQLAGETCTCPTITSTHFQFWAFRVSGKIGPLALLENHPKI